MGKSLPSSSKFQELARIVSSVDKPRRTNLVSNQNPNPARANYGQQKPKLEMDRAEPERRQTQTQPLSLVVADCAKRWFQDTLKEAKAGDNSMQVLVGQMYFNGYGVTKDPNKGRAWISKASKTRASVWRVGDKQPGYNASDSDSEGVKETTNTAQQ